MIELPPFDALALSLHHAPGTQALLVGSGLSRAAGIPTGWEITLDLVRRLAALKGIKEHANWEKWFRDEHGGKEPSYSELLDALASTAAERRAILHSYIEPPEGDEDSRRPTKAHQAVARLVKAGAVKVIVTTNFDRLIENALRDEGIEPTVIAGEDAIAGAEPLVHARCAVIKVHGDYLDTRIKNTDAELTGYGAAMNALLDQVFDNFGLTVVGWSGEWDTALRDAIARQPNRRFPVYWAARGKIGPLAQDLIDRRGGRSFGIANADTFFVKLEQQLEALKQASRPHPQSAEMAVALAKRYCRDDRFAMEWTEFLHAEVEKIKRFVTGPEYPSAQPTPENFNDLINAFVVHSEILRRACLVCGRWGTVSANRAVIRALKLLVLSSNAGGGYTTWISLRDFAASLCFYWNLAGIADAEAWSSASTLLSAEVNNGREMERLHEKLSLAGYGGNSVDWKWLKGFETKIVPASEFTVEIFKSEGRDIAASAESAENLFDQIELLIAASAAHPTVARGHGAESIWVPSGRFVWKESGQFLRQQIDRISALPDSDPFFASGMLGGRQALAQQTLSAVGEWVKKHFGRHAYMLDRR
ncbi:MAG: SIR2 family protein [Methylobacterium sp.]|nr:SIR2 family protein [Methylobacterium sp.]